MGAGHNVTALYELIPAGSKEGVGSIDPLKYQDNQEKVKPDPGAELLTVKLRYKKPDGVTSTKFEEAVKGEIKELKSTSVSFRFSAAVAEFGLILRDSEFKGNASIKDVITLAQNSRGDDAEGYRGEFIKLVNTAESLIDMRADK
jgi:Ca-activated chloride channel family protein